MSTQASTQIAKQYMEGALNKKNWGTAMYNVLVEGLVGGGVIDDTVALQTLVNTAIAAGRKAIFFPHGTYYVTALTNANQVIFLGDNASFVGGYTGEIIQLGEGRVTQAEFDALVTDFNTLEAETVTGISNAKTGFGVVGDGVTNDQVAFQDMFTDSAVGDSMFIPPGTYLVDRQSGLAALQGFKSGQVLRGSGIDVTTIQFHARSLGTYGLFFSGLSGFELSDMTIEMIDAPTVDILLIGVLFQNCSGIKIRNVKVKGAWHSHGLRLEACTDSEMIDCIADNVIAPYATGSTRKALSVGSDGSGNRSKNISVMNCTVKNCIGGNIMDGIGVADSDNITIGGNHCHNNDYGINPQNCTGLIITENTCHDNVVIGIDMSNGCTDSVVDGNHCYSNGNDGIRFWGNTFQGAERTIISNNVCYNNGKTTALSAGIRLSDQNASFPSKNTVVAGNLCYDTRSGASRTQDYGIFQTTNSAYSFIQDNYCFNNKTTNESVVSNGQLPMQDYVSLVFTPAALVSQVVTITFKVPFNVAPQVTSIVIQSPNSADAVQNLMAQPRNVTTTTADIVITTRDATSINTKASGNLTVNVTARGKIA